MITPDESKTRWFVTLYALLRVLISCVVQVGQISRDFTYNRKQLIDVSTLFLNGAHNNVVGLFFIDTGIGNQNSVIHVQQARAGEAALG